MNLAIGLLAFAAGAAWAGHADPELVDALGAIPGIVRAQPGLAEDVWGSLTRSHPEDPRPWIGLGDARVAAKAAWAADSAYRHAAVHATEATRLQVDAKRKAAGLKPLAARGVVTDFKSFKERAAADACARSRSLGSGAPDSCPVLGLAFKATAQGPACPRHSLVWRDENPYLIDAAVLKECLRGPAPWMRAEAAWRIDQPLLTDEVLKAYAGESDAAVRRAVLTRLLGGLPDLTLGTGAKRLARAYANDSAFEVRCLAWRLGYALGEVPTLGLDDFRLLVIDADRGWVSKYLVRELFRRQKKEAMPLLRRMLREPVLDGKAVAIAVLALDGGKEGLMAIAQAMKSPSAGLRERMATARRALRDATGKDHGRDADAWIKTIRGEG